MDHPILYYSIVILLVIHNFYHLNDASRSFEFNSFDVETIVIPTNTHKHTASVIFLHGVGDTGHGLYAVFCNVRQPYMKVICPTSQRIPFTLRSHQKLYAWFDIKDRNFSKKFDIPQINKSTAYVHHLIDEEIKSGIPSEQVYLGGFSQGGTLALHAALTYPKKLGGVIAYSTWFPKNRTYYKSKYHINDNIPVLKCHNRSDTESPWKLLQDIQHKAYEGYRTQIADEEINMMQKWLRNLSYGGYLEFITSKEGKWSQDRS